MVIVLVLITLVLCLHWFQYAGIHKSQSNHVEIKSTKNHIYLIKSQLNYKAHQLEVNVILIWWDMFIIAC